MEEKMQAYFLNVFQWVVNASSWLGIGPVWQMIGVLLFGFTILQFCPESAAGGWLFCKKALKITLALDAVWVYLIFVAPFVPGSVTIALLIVGTLVIAAILAHRKWH